MHGRTTRASDLLGQSLTSLCGGALALNLLLASGCSACSPSTASAYFWQKTDRRR